MLLKSELDLQQPEASLLIKSHKIVNVSTTTEAREENKREFRITRILEKFWHVFYYILNIQNLLNKIRNQFLVTTKLFIVSNILLPNGSFTNMSDFESG